MRSNSTPTCETAFDIAVSDVRWFALFEVDVKIQLPQNAAAVLLTQYIIIRRPTV